MTIIHHSLINNTISNNALLGRDVCREHNLDDKDGESLKELDTSGNLCMFYMNCVQTNIVTSQNPAWTERYFCYAQNILYCNFDHNCSDCFYLSPPSLMWLACIYGCAVRWPSKHQCRYRKS